MAEEDHKLRIFHGPENICGIGGFLADWQRENKGVNSDFIVYQDNSTFQNSHFNLQIEKDGFCRKIFRQFSFFLRSLREYDIFNFYFGKTLLPFNIDLPFLKLAGKKILMIYVGSDIRLTKLEIERNPYYFLRKTIEKKYSPPDWLKILRMKWHNLWCDKCIAPRGLLLHAKKGFPEKKIIDDLWVTNTIRVPDKKPDFLHNKVPMIVHAPTNPERKGTRYLQSALDELKSEGYQFDFRIFNNISHEELLNFVKDEADIVVDQLISGDFGSFTMEGLSMGKPVCSYVMDEIRENLPGLPVIQTTIETIKEKLAWLIDNPQERVQIGIKGWEYAKEHFDENMVNSRLWELYDQILDRDTKK